MPITHGLHHVTAVTADAKENVRFYTEVLGLRLVKKTVNQDDVSAYHLFYADAIGSPGTDMTFFDWEQALPQQVGADQISRTFFRVDNQKSLAFWQERLEEYGVEDILVTNINSRDAILFGDSEGQRLGLVEDGGAEFHGEVWGGALVPREHAIKGFYAVELTVPELESVSHILHDILGWKETQNYIHPMSKNSVTVFEMDGGGPGKQVHIHEEVSDVAHGSTAGSVHHVAFRVDDEHEMLEWAYHLERMGIPHSGIVERFYFKSLYFRITRGILFEIATDGPGFTADESIENLGKRLSLPPFLEPDREIIERGLQPL